MKERAGLGAIGKREYGWTQEWCGGPVSHTTVGLPPSRRVHMYPAAQQYIIHLSSNKRRTNSRNNSSRMISFDCFSSSFAAGKSISLLLTLVAIVLLGRPVNSLGSCKAAGLCCTGRDASCVVQKTPQNAIIEDLRDTPCYCDHACLKLNDCCPDYRQTCGVQDCQVSEWGPWSDCDNQCGSGSQERTRTLMTEPSRGGKSCPPTLQKRGCQGASQCGTNKSTHHKAALKEMAMLLPASFGASRRMNDSHDIRKNLRYRNAELAQEHPEGSTNDYCVTFELTKVSKACHKEKVFNSLLDGGVVCVRCEHKATRDYLGGRCGGHGVPGRITRWTSLTNVECHGKWLRRPSDESQEVSNSTCSYAEDALLIFV